MYITVLCFTKANFVFFGKKILPLKPIKIYRGGNEQLIFF